MQNKNSLFHLKNVSEECALKASVLMKNETTPTAGTVKVAKGLVDIAVSIELLNLQLEQETRLGRSGRAF